MNGQNDNVNAAIRRIAEKVNSQADVIEQLQSYLKGMSQTQKWIEDIPGARSPHIEVIEIAFSANSTARKTGTTTLSVDGPFVCTAIGLFYCETDGPYPNVWGPATAFGSRMAEGSTGMQWGFDYVFDKPNCASFTFEIRAHGTERLWQNKPVATALFSPEAGGVYVLPAGHLFARASSITMDLTPDVASPHAGKCQALFLGYRIVQGYQFQP